MMAGLLSLSGCASLDQSFVPMAVSHNQTLDQIERSNLLLNILRAADEQPISFTAVSYVSGNGSVGGSVNASNGFGHLLNLITGVSASGGLNVNQGFGYSLVTLDNEQFTRNFLADIPMDRLYFLSEGTHLDNTVLYTLVIQQLYRTPAATKGSPLVSNLVQPHAWAAFQGLLAHAMTKGLSMELAPVETPVGPPLSRDEATYQVGTVINGWNPAAWGPPQAGAARPLIKQLPGAGGNSDRPFQLVMLADLPRFCYAPATFHSWPHADEHLCRNTLAARRSRRLEDRNGGEAAAQQGPGTGTGSPVAVSTAAPLPLDWPLTSRRSPREVFYFLGQIVRAQFDRPGHRWQVGDPSVAAGTRPLFNVVCADKPPSQEPLAMAPFKGQTCYVPRNDGSHSADVLQYLALLVTLSKVSGAIPASPGVVIR
jgi:hypothetical protein